MAIESKIPMLTQKHKNNKTPTANQLYNSKPAVSFAYHLLLSPNVNKGSSLPQITPQKSPRQSSMESKVQAKS